MRLTSCSPRNLAGVAHAPSARRRLAWIGIVGLSVSKPRVGNFAKAPAAVKKIIDWRSLDGSLPSIVRSVGA
jgi:hypothetical protein